jgi:mono/diheme cytochrome c family protein
VSTLSLAVACISAGFLAMPASQAVAAEAATKKAAAKGGDAKAGQQLFNSTCMQCHSTNEGQVLFGPSLYHETKKATGKKTPAEIREIITNGKGKMPPLGSKFDDKQKDDIIAYVKTL